MSLCLKFSDNSDNVTYRSLKIFGQQYDNCQNFGFSFLFLLKGTMT